MNLIELDVVSAAWTGEVEPLAKAISEGKQLTEEAGEFLTLFLRGEIKWRRGNKRTFSQFRRDKDILFTIQALAYFQDVTIEQAIHEYCSRNDTNYETVRSAMKRANSPETPLHPMCTYNCIG